MTSAPSTSTPPQSSDRSHRGASPRAPSAERPPAPPIHAMAVTPFAAEGGLDERALRQAVDRYARAGVGVYLGSYGSGKGHLLREHEIERLYAVGVEAAGGRTPVHAAAIDFTDTDRVIEQAKAALAKGVQRRRSFPIGQTQSPYGTKAPDPPPMRTDLVPYAKRSRR